MERLEKTRAFLTEFIIVILFFTISSVITVQLFVAANKNSSQSMLITKGYLMAEELAEEIKANIDVNSEYAVSDYIINNRGYIQDDSIKGEYYYQYYDKDFVETDEENGYIYGYVSVEKESKEAGKLYTVTIGFENSQGEISKIQYKIYEGEVQP